MSKMLRFQDTAFLEVPISQVKLAPLARWRSLRFARNNSDPFTDLITLTNHLPYPTPTLQKLACHCFRLIFSEIFVKKNQIFSILVSFHLEFHGLTFFLNKLICWQYFLEFFFKPPIIKLKPVQRLRLKILSEERVNIIVVHRPNYLNFSFSTKNNLFF